jgi:extracellular factor (EF) 3-hydroxypalmitic acid methyl ester biosynthesis protein
MGISVKKSSCLLESHGSSDPISKLNNVVDDFVALKNRLPMDHDAAYCETVLGVQQLCSAIDHALLAGSVDEEIWVLIEPARAVHAQSPFWQRVYSWPRGVVGDYLTIEWLCDGRLQSPPGSIAACLERYLFSCLAAQQHRNKVAWQAEHIRFAIRLGARKVLSVACGGSRDLRLCLTDLKGDTLFFLNDADEEAIRFSTAHLREIEHQLRPIAGNLLRSLRRFSELGPFDLIVAGGIFDYLNDDLFCKTTSRLIACLAPRGKLCLTNFAKPNPYRTWMKYFGDWVLVERTEPQIRQLLEDTTAGDVDLEFSREATGLAVLVTAQRGAE